MDPARRPQSARVLGDQLHHALLGMQPPSIQVPAPPPPPSFSYTVPPPAAVAEKPKRKKWVYPVAAMAVGWAIYSGRDKPKRTVEPSRQEATTAAAPSDEAIELVYWNSVKDSEDPQLFREYLSKYPDGEFASLANAKIQSLEKTGAKGAPAPPAHPSTGPDAADSAIQQVAKAIGAGGNKFAELAVWEDVKESDEAKPYQDYLAKYPDGMFASLARTKISKLEAGALDRKLPPPREALKLSEYKGPMEGDIRWEGKVGNNAGLTIQGGKVSAGEMTGDLPRVPVTVAITRGQGTLVSLPAQKNQWDQVGVRNVSGKVLTSMAIHWKVSK